ncbi:MAG: NrsF family protein [Oligoflexales bacterium]
MKNEQLIDKLVTDLQPVKVLPSYVQRAIFWSCISNLLVALFTMLSGPFRANFVDQLLSHPQFLAEFLVGILVNPLACFSLFYLVIPSEHSTNFKRIVIGVLPFIMLLTLALISTIYPALPPSMEGKRDYCSEQTLLFGIIPFICMWVAVKKSCPWHQYWVGIYLSIAAFTPGAIIMHIACMYAPFHILQRHLLPIIAASFIGMMIVNSFLLRKN